MEELQKLILAEDIYDMLKKGKETTIRKGRRDIALGKLLFESIDEKRYRMVNVLMVYYCKLSNVFISDVTNDGFKNHNDMWYQMKRFYPDITFDSEVTVIKFKSK